MAKKPAKFPDEGEIDWGDGFVTWWKREGTKFTVGTKTAPPKKPKGKEHADGLPVSLR